jgi:hypothetical protein
VVFDVAVKQPFARVHCIKCNSDAMILNHEPSVSVWPYNIVTVDFNKLLMRSVQVNRMSLTRMIIFVREPNPITMTNFKCIGVVMELFWLDLPLIAFFDRDSMPSVNHPIWNTSTICRRLEPWRRACAIAFEFCTIDVGFSDLAFGPPLTESHLEDGVLDRFFLVDVITNLAPRKRWPQTQWLVIN